jgi:hypothetical protein
MKRRKLEITKNNEKENQGFTANYQKLSVYQKSIWNDLTQAIYVTSYGICKDTKIRIKRENQYIHLVEHTV